MNNRAKLKRIQEIITEYLNVLEKLPKGEQIDQYTAEKLGIDRDIKPIIESAYKYGRLRGRTNKQIARDSVEQYFRNLSPQSQEILEIKEEEAQQNLSELLERTRTKVSRSSIEAMKRNYGVIEGVFGDEPIPVRWMAEELRKVTGDARQDWDMVIRTELIQARQEGMAHEILEGTSPLSDDGGETMVYKVPSPDCCEHCRRLYLDNRGVPKVFKLSEMLSYGTNFGRKTQDWKPVWGIAHPHCQCEGFVLPKDTYLDESGNIKAIKKERKGG